MAIRLESGKLLRLESGGSVAQSVEVVPDAENFSATSASDTAELFRSTGQSRDMEVSLTARPANGTVFLRYNGTSGIYFKFNGATSLHIGLATGIVGQAYNTPATSYTRIYQDVGLSTGTYVCGVSGVEIYVKVNGTKIVSFYDWHIPQTGYAMVKAANTLAMAGTATFLATATTYSVPSLNFWDIRDFGAQALATTGSISASSTSLVVADSTGFSVGDHVIVEIGAEAGLGVRGTKGVGGVWPALSYADATARAADTSQANGKWAYQVDTGNVYRWATGSPGAWTQETQYYSAKAIPRSLFARITAKSGNTLTLSTAATVTATNANVYFENSTKISQLTNSIIYHGGLNSFGNFAAFETSQPTIYIPAGNFRYASSMRTYANRQFKGAGATSILTTPKGVPGGLYLATTSTGEVANNFKMVGNVDDNGHALAWAMTTRYDGVDSTGVLYFSNEDTMSETSGLTYPRGVWTDGATGAIARYITTLNIFMQSVCFSTCTNCEIRNCDTTYTFPFRQYVQWGYQLTDGSGGGIYNCTVTNSQWLSPGFELFRMTGNATIDSCTGTNALVSSNSSGNITYNNLNLSFTTNCEHSSAVIIGTGPIININDNIGSGYAGSPISITNTTITVAGVSNAANDILRAIIVNARCPYVTIDGGTITLPNFVVGGNTDSGHGLSDEAHTVWANLTLVGNSRFTVTGGGNKQITNRNSSTIANGSSVTSCGSDYTLS